MPGTPERRYLHFTCTVGQHRLFDLDFHMPIIMLSYSYSRQWFQLSPVKTLRIWWTAESGTLSLVGLSLALRAIEFYRAP